MVKLASWAKNKRTEFLFSRSKKQPHLLSEAGINYHFEHQEDRHTLVLADHLGAYQPLPSAAYHTLSVYPPELKLQEEYIHSFNPYQRVITGQVMLADYQFKSPQGDTRVSQKAEL